MQIYGESRIDTISSILIGDGKPFDLLRDDLIHPIVCGNKWRKLKYVIEHATSSGIKDLVSFGGAYSNHLVALAHAGKSFGFRTHGFIRGEETTEPNHYKKICLDCGMNLIHVSRTDYKDKEKLYKNHFGSDPEAMFIAEGGDHPLALKGVAEMFDLIGSDYDNIILSLGTGTTMEGLLAEAEKRNIRSKIIGISSLKNNYSLDSRMTPYQNGNNIIYHEYHRGKYAKQDEELQAFILNFFKETGIRTEFVYTAKMLKAFNDLLVRGEIDKKARNICIHTGGLLAFPGFESSGFVI